MVSDVVGRLLGFEQAPSCSLGLMLVGVGHNMCSGYYGLESRALQPGIQILTTPYGGRTKALVGTDTLGFIGEHGVAAPRYLGIYWVAMGHGIYPQGIGPRE